LKETLKSQIISSIEHGTIVAFFMGVAISIGISALIVGIILGIIFLLIE
jgi:hypothetical protein